MREWLAEGLGIALIVSSYLAAHLVPGVREAYVEHVSQSLDEAFGALAAIAIVLAVYEVLRRLPSLFSRRARI